GPPRATGFAEPKFPDPSVIPAEGWYKTRLSVTGQGGTDEDTVRIYVDKSNLPARYWSLQHEALQFPAWGEDYTLAEYPIWLTDRRLDSLKVLDDQGGVSPRLLVRAGKTVFALDNNGALVWEKRPQMGPPFHFSHDFSRNLAVDVVGGDRVVLFAAHELKNFTDGEKLFIYLLKLTDGTPLNNANWPVEIDGTIPEHVAIADVAGGPEMEVIITEIRRYHVGVSASNVSGPKLRVLDHNGNEVWTRTFPVELFSLEGILTANVDGAGKDEIIIVGTGQILKGDNTFLPAWGAAGTYKSVDVVQRSSGNPDIVLADYGGNISLKTYQGGVRPGWPISATGGVSVTAGQVVAAGHEEIVVWKTTIKVYDTNGAPPTGWTDIDLNGNCSRLILKDVDNDNTDEFVALVNRLNQAPAATELVGSYLEVYEFDGNRLGDTDTRWPVHLPFLNLVVSPLPPDMHRQVTIGDVDGDAKLEVVQLLRILPWESGVVAPSARIEVMDLD
ncbi:MAG: hypothetical protein ACE5MG_10105, partial [Candidatus Methylomirabilales bacterium]